MFSLAVGAIVVPVLRESRYGALLQRTLLFVLVRGLQGQDQGAVNSVFFFSMAVVYFDATRTSLAMNVKNRYTLPASAVAVVGLAVSLFLPVHFQLLRIMNEIVMVGMAVFFALRLLNA